MKITLGKDIRSIALATLWRDPEFNVRPPVDKRDPEIKALGADIAAKGLIHPIVAWPRADWPAELAARAPEGAENYLVSGWRRVAGAESAGLSEIDGRDFTGDYLGALAINTKENTARKDVSPAAIAKRLVMFADTGLSAKEIAALLGAPGESPKSKGYVNKLIRIRRFLCETLWQHFEAGHPAASTDKMYQAALMTVRAPDGEAADVKAQHAYWGQITANADQEPQAGDDKSGGGHKRGRNGKASRPRPVALEAALINLPRQVADKETVSLVGHVLAFVLGKSPVLKVAGVQLYPPPDQGKAAKGKASKSAARAKNAAHLERKGKPATAKAAKRAPRRTAKGGR